MSSNKDYKAIKTRIQNKYDTQENFANATFIPLKGEILFYDVDGTLEHRKMKVGDGDTRIGDLPFYCERISGTVTKEIGGITKNTSYENASITDVLSDLLFPYVAPTFSSISTSASSGTFEYGTTRTVATVTPNFTLGSKHITSVKIGTSSGGSDLYSGTSATSGTAITLTTSKTFDGSTGGTIYCTISDGTTTVTKSASVSYAYYPYAIASTSSDLTSVTSSATKSSSTTTSSAISLTLATDSYVWFLLPPETSGSKTIQYEALGQWYEFAGGTTGPVDVSLKLNSGITVTYKGYRTNKMAAAGTTSFKIV